jgi:uncharacterized protein YlzI (FlbEa/FlbD family)
MITLTNALGYPVDINPDNIEYYEICELPKTSEQAQKGWPGNMGVEIHFVSGKSVKVEECLSKIRELIKEFKNKPA